jgi:hypothetical protein
MICVAALRSCALVWVVRLAGSAAGAGRAGKYD